MELKNSEIIGYAILVFFGLGATFIIIQVLSPFFFVGFSALAVMTYPFVLIIRAAGFKNCPSLFPMWKMLFASIFTNQYQKPQQNEANQKQYHQTDKKSRQVRPKEPDFDPWGVLEIPRNATKEEIKTAYKKKVVLNHPDKVASLDPALQTFATQRTVLLQKAYEQLVETV